MQKIYHLYLDDSGTRHPDRKPGRKPAHGNDWFGLGGVIIAKDDEIAFRNVHRDFLKKWAIDKPLHSSEIRAKSDGFAFIGTLSEIEQQRFFEELYQLMANAPVIGIGCIIDRPGYNHRYLGKYGRQRWSLCKTAFPVVVERAAKYAIENGGKLRVYLERSDKKTDSQMQAYYDSLRQEGMPFAAPTSAKYAPLTSTELKSTLYEFRTKEKSSPVMQLADLYLWPIAIGGYDPQNLPYRKLMKDNKLINCHLSAEEVDHKGIKYSCWDLVQKRA